MFEHTAGGWLLLMRCNAGRETNPYNNVKTTETGLAARLIITAGTTNEQTLGQVYSLR